MAVVVGEKEKMAESLKREKQVQYFKHMGETSGVGAVAGFTMTLNDKEVTDNE